MRNYLQKHANLARRKIQTDEEFQYVTLLDVLNSPLIVSACFIT
jgi:hypothetical protein